MPSCTPALHSTRTCFDVDVGHIGDTSGQSIKHALVLQLSALVQASPTSQSPLPHAAKYNTPCKSHTLHNVSKLEVHAHKQDSAALVLGIAGAQYATRQRLKRAHDKLASTIHW